MAALHHQSHLVARRSLAESMIRLPQVYWLVVLTILKNMKVNGKDYPIYIDILCLEDFGWDCPSSK